MSSSTVIIEVLFFAKAREILKTSESQITIGASISSAQGNLLNGIDNKTIKRQRFRRLHLLLLSNKLFKGNKMFKNCNKVFFDQTTLILKFPMHQNLM